MLLTLSWGFCPPVDTAGSRCAGSLLWCWRTLEWATGALRNRSGRRLRKNVKVKSFNILCMSSFMFSLSVDINWKLLILAPWSYVIFSAFSPADMLSNAVANVICSIVFGQRFEFEDPQFKFLLHTVKSAIALLDRYCTPRSLNFFMYILYTLLKIKVTKTVFPQKNLSMNSSQKKEVVKKKSVVKQIGVKS